MPDSWAKLQKRIVDCERCPRLRKHCAGVARQKRAAYRDEIYWGKPVPNFGEAGARSLIVGLAPGAHGANRTGRMFTGDRSGDFLYDALYRTGFANQPTAVGVDDGLELIDCAITAAAHCAPPSNKPTPEELNNCTVHLDDTVKLMRNLRVIVCLGGIALDCTLKMYRRFGWPVAKPKPRFRHGAELKFAPDVPRILCCYHPSQQNTFTGRLTKAMMVEVFERAGMLSRESP